MKRILAPILLLTLLFPSLAFGETMDDLVETDGLYYKKSTEVPFTGKTTGKTQGTFKDGKKHGPWVFYRENGQLSSKGTYKDGKWDGPWVFYHDNGQLYRKGTFKNGKKNGPWVSIFADGTVWEKFTGTFLNGKKVKPSQYIGSEIHHQISQCWNIPLTIPKTEYLRIKVKIELKMNGGLKIEPIIIDKLQYKNSEYYRLQEKSVMMSLKNPKCVPLKLPVSLYNIWKKTVFTFDFRSFTVFTFDFRSFFD